jgi:hypothetical protein
MFAEGPHEHQQASQPCPQRQRFPVFEPMTPGGTKIATIKIFCFKNFANSRIFTLNDAPDSFDEII